MVRATIALIEAYHDPTISADLTSFDQAFGLSNPSLTVVNQGTRPGESPSR
jgi:subtilase family serine protease